jgi:glutathione S-transferase
MHLALCEVGDPGIEGIESLSPYCVKVHRALKYAGLPYERLHRTHPGAFGRENPKKLVPVLLIDGEAVADSTDICARVDAFSKKTLIPTDPRARAEALLWEELGDSAVNGFFVAARWFDDRNWPIARESIFAVVPSITRRPIAWMMRRRVLAQLWHREVTRGGVEECWRRFSVLLDQLDSRAPAAGYWIGDDLTVADLGLFAQLHSLRNRLTAPQRDEIARRPALTAWLDRVDIATRGQIA